MITTGHILNELRAIFRIKALLCYPGHSDQHILIQIEYLYILELIATRATVMQPCNIPSGYTSRGSEKILGSNQVFKTTSTLIHYC